MNSEEVANYLKENPDFFENHQEILADIETAAEQQPFHQRQLEVLRQRHSAEQARYQTVVDSARNNQALEQTLHGFARQLLKVQKRNAGTAAEIVQREFDLDQTRIFLSAKEQNDCDLDLELLVKRVAHGSSICDDRVSSDLLLQLFGPSHTVKSCAFVPMGQNTSSNGVMILGANEEDRFQPGMGAIYLDRIGELVYAFLSQGD